MVCRTNGVSDRWCVGPMVCRTIGVSDQWCVGPMICNPQIHIKNHHQDPMLFADFLAITQQIEIYKHSFQKYSNSPENYNRL